MLHEGCMPDPPPEFRSLALAKERLGAGQTIPRHRHRHGYVTVVLAGSYEEAGLDGRRQLSAGEVVVHKPWDAHLDHVGRSGAEVLNLPLPAGLDLPVAFAIADADAIARVAERDAAAAVRALAPASVQSTAADWPDLLAAELAAGPRQSLRDWAEEMRLAAETLSRGFRRAFGITPAQFRTEVRVRRALQQITEQSESLASVAAGAGFADQAHLTRAVVALTGRTPGFWRRESISFKKVATARH